MAASVPITCMNAHNLHKAVAVRGPGHDDVFPRLLAPSPDNRHVAISWGNNQGSLASLAIIDYSGRVVKRLRLTSERMLCLQYDSSGRYLAYILQGDFDSVLYVWEVRTFSLVLKRTLPTAGAVRMQFVKGRGKDELFAGPTEDQLVLTGVGPGVQVQESLRALPKELSLDIADDDLCTISSDARIAVWLGWGWGRLGAEDSEDTSVQLWDLNAKELLWSQSLRAEECAGRDVMCFHPSGKFLAIGQYGQTDVRETAHGSLVKRLPTDRHLPPEWIRFSPDGTLLATTLYDSVILWDWEWGAPAVSAERSRSAHIRLLQRWYSVDCGRIK